MRVGRRQAGKGVALAVAAVLVATLSACAPTYTYLTSSSSQSYLAVPHAWKVYDQKTILAKTGSTGSFPYLAFFDDNAHPSLNDSLNPTSQPWGVLRIRDLASSERETYSFDSLSNELIQLDQLSQSGQAAVLGPTQVLTHGGLRGIRQEVSVVVGQQTVVAVEAGYVNAATTKVWSLLVGCSAVCFSRNQGAIDRLVQSWTVGKT